MKKPTVFGVTSQYVPCVFYRSFNYGRMIIIGGYVSYSIPFVFFSYFFFPKVVPV